ncbi:MAG: SPFH domain-containing protein [Elusimicrobia bacterium]|nr:SPFH domain-containing protein [Elusimicrobiota bacterium]
METTLVMLVVAASVILMTILAIMFAIRHFYVVPNADEALVKTGGSSPVVSTGGGMWVVPMFHRAARVSLRAVRIPIEREKENALPTANKIPAEIRGELIVRVSPEDPSHVILAAQALGSAGADSNQMERLIQEQVDSLVTDALRTAAFKKTFQELNAGKKEFADEVTQLLAEDLGKLGLTLVAVTVPHLKQGNFTSDAGDVFAAEGQRNVAETVAKNRQETNLINRDAEIKIQEQNVNARKRALELDRQQKELEAEQTRQVAEYTATKATETRQAVLKQDQATAEAEAEQSRAVAMSRIQQAQATEGAQIAKDQAIATAKARASAEQKKAEEEAGRVGREAEIARAKSVEAAEIAKDQAVKVADQQRTQAVSEAEIAREVAVATKRAEEADARAKQALAEAERQKAEQSIVTVEAEARADRERKVVVIKADEEAQKAKVAADRDAYVQTTKAEADRAAASKNADATLLAAEGKANAVTAEATGRANALKADAEGHAEAAKSEATGRADAMRIQAGAEAEARTVRATAEFDASDKEAKAKIALAGAVLEEGRARAESEKLMVEARNAVSNAVVMQAIAIEAIRQAPAVVREFMAPIAAVSDVRVLQINGLGGGGEDGANVPATILGAGLAASGALPLVREAVRGLLDNPDVRDVASALSGVATQALREASAAARATPSGHSPSNGA